MIKMFISGIDKAVEVVDSFNVVRIEANKEYRSIVFELENYLTLSKDNVPIDLTKNALFLYNPFQLNLNDKKIVNALYKYLLKQIDDEERIIISRMENLSNEFLDNLAFKSSLAIDYDDSIDLSKLLSSFNVSLKQYDKNNYIELLLDYFKIQRELLNTKYVIAFGLSNLLTKDELVTLEYELKVLDLVVIDLIFSSRFDDSIITIDSDWCII